MFVFGLKKTQVWVTMALLVLCCSICPHLCYPYADEDEEPAGVKENLENVEDHEQEFDQDEEEEVVEDEETLLKEAADVENALPEVKLCQKFHQYCSLVKDNCCRDKDDDLKCDDNGMCVSNFKKT